jgi:hypothetical protein
MGVNMSSDQEILKTISYITDDRYIASYHGVDLKRVIGLRKTMHERKVKIEAAAQVSKKAAPIDMSNDCERKWNASAKKGSAELRDALLAFFEKRALEEGKSNG